MSDLDIFPQSPCVRNCCLDDELVCLGCFRTIEEIKEWGTVDSDRRSVILHNARGRRAASEEQRAAARSEGRTRRTTVNHDALAGDIPGKLAG